MYNEKTGNPNHRNVATYVALTWESVNIPDAYEAEEFDFTGTKKFDEGTGFQVHVVPHRAHEEPRGRRDRRPAASQRPGFRERRGHPSAATSNP